MIDGEIMNNGVHKELISDLMHEDLIEANIDRIDINGLDGSHLNSKVLNNPLFDLLSKGITEMGLKSDFDPIDHTKCS